MVLIPDSTRVCPPSAKLDRYESCWLSPHLTRFAVGSTLPWSSPREGGLSERVPDFPRWAKFPESPSHQFWNDGVG